MITQILIKHVDTDVLLFNKECSSVRECVEAAIKAGADLSGAYLSGANLVRANLARADLSCADFRDIDLIDGGQSICGHRFWCWRDSHGAIVYRAGCHEWRSFDEAVDYYGESYAGDGSRQEGIARLTLMYDAAFRRWQS